jgi:hypothetical protein
VAASTWPRCARSLSRASTSTCRADAARERWIAARQQELLPTRYAHVVLTLPRRLAPLVLQNKKLIYDLLFRTSAETLLEVARNPLRLGAEIGFFSVLHTWNQKLELHPHVHCVVPAGGHRCSMKAFSAIRILRVPRRGSRLSALPSDSPLFFASSTISYTTLFRRNLLLHPRCQLVHPRARSWRTSTPLLLIIEFP